MKFFLIAVALYVVWSLVDADKQTVAKVSTYNLFHFFPSLGKTLGLK